MHITVVDDTRLTVTSSPDLQIDEDGEAHFGPMQMLAASLGSCILAVLHAWGDRVDADPGGIEVEVSWGYADQPYRVGSFDTRIRWPGLPDDRRQVARRVAGTCTVHHTLEHPPEMTVRLESG
jgi:uncharacterized OsmC-like protein